MHDTTVTIKIPKFNINSPFKNSKFVIFVKEENHFLFKKNSRSVFNENTN